MVDVAFGVEDWAAEAPLFAPVAIAYKEPALSEGGTAARLDAAVTADWLITIEESLAQPLLVTGTAVRTGL